MNKILNLSNHTNNLPLMPFNRYIDSHIHKYIFIELDSFKVPPAPKLKIRFSLLLIYLSFFFHFLLTDDSNDMVLKTLIASRKIVGMIIVEVAWLALGVVWLVNFYMTVHASEAREIMLGK